MLAILDAFQKMTNECIRIGLDNDVSTMKRLSVLSYRQLGRHKIHSIYKLCAISKAAGILVSRKKSIRRGFKVKRPYLSRLMASGYRYFKVINGLLLIPLGDHKYFRIQLNAHVQEILSETGITMRSFSLTKTTATICYSKNIDQIKTIGVAGVDRNLRNIAYANPKVGILYDVTKATEIVDNTQSIVRSFKRNDVRIRTALYAKYGRRRRNRINQLLHTVSKHIVKTARENMEGIAFEDIRNIRKMYQRGNGQSKTYRNNMNTWSFSQIKRQIEYKAAWAGIPIIQLSRQDTRGTSRLCPQCGERLQEDRYLRRQLWCNKCHRLMDRDLVAAMNIGHKGWAWFAHSKGVADEAMNRNAAQQGEWLILRVDATKLAYIKG